MSTYVFGHPGQEERDRLVALQDLFDPSSFARLAALGVGPGWRCLEVGAGTGSVAHWLADRVGPDGEVLATDIDPKFLDTGDRPNVTVRRHDVAADPLPPDTFDVAHARCVLEHLPARDEALARIVASVRPGGWVFLEDTDFSLPLLDALAQHATGDGAGLGRKVTGGLAALFAASGSDMTFSQRLPQALRRAGLTDVGAELHAPLVRGGSPNDFGRLTIERVRPMLVSRGLLTESEVEDFLTMNADPGFSYLPIGIVSAWGRRP